MLAKLRDRLTYANVVATLALFVALGGSSYAAFTVTGRNVKNSSLSGRDIKNSSLSGRDVKNNSLTGKDVKSIKSADVSDRSLLAKDFKAGQLPTGPQGQTGAPGTARAYAIIDPSTCTTAAGSCTLLRAKNVVAARRSPNNPTAGFYCITTGSGIDRAADGFMAGVVWDETQAPRGNASAMPMVDPPPAPAQVCPGDFTIATERTTGTSSDLVNDVGFWFAVP